MNEFEQILQSLNGIMEFYLTKRKDYSLECLLESPVKNGQSAYELFLHTVKTLYQFIHEKFTIEPRDLIGKPNDELIDVPDDVELPLYQRMINQLEKASDSFSEAINSLPSEKYEEYREKIATLVMHTVLHGGMVLRTQKQYIENNMINLTTDLQVA
ncbi:MAG: hypothetical protein HeimC3_07440 [Candidatus Heimdallarchaeota archaeon LC_3]|nr:MAG: hypothetical protein HeimC3_07440 [Candidatus Heimdallarchaeota archaeon LC_3]